MRILDVSQIHELHGVLDICIHEIIKITREIAGSNTYSYISSIAANGTKVLRWVYSAACRSHK